MKVRRTESKVENNSHLPIAPASEAHSLAHSASLPLLHHSTTALLHHCTGELANCIGRANLRDWQTGTDLQIRRLTD